MSPNLSNCNSKQIEHSIDKSRHDKDDLEKSLQWGILQKIIDVIKKTKYAVFGLFMLTSSFLLNDEPVQAEEKKEILHVEDGEDNYKYEAKMTKVLEKMVKHSNGFNTILDNIKQSIFYLNRYAKGKLGDNRGKIKDILQKIDYSISFLEHDGLTRMMLDFSQHQHNKKRLKHYRELCNDLIKDFKDRMLIDLDKSLETILTNMAIDPAREKISMKFGMDIKNGGENVKLTHAERLVKDLEKLGIKVIYIKEAIDDMYNTHKTVIFFPNWHAQISEEERKKSDTFKLNNIQKKLYKSGNDHKLHKRESLNCKKSILSNESIKNHRKDAELPQKFLYNAIKKIFEDNISNTIIFEGIDINAKPKDIKQYVKELNELSVLEFFGDKKALSESAESVDGAGVEDWDLMNEIFSSNPIKLTERIDSHNIFIADNVFDIAMAQLGDVVVFSLGVSHEYQSQLPISEILALYGFDVIVVDESENLFPEKLKSNKDYAKLFLVQGIQAYALGDSLNAERFWVKANELDPDNGGAATCLANMYRQRKNIPKESEIKWLK